MFEKLNSCIKRLRELKPLVLCLTNYVSMDLMANSLLAIGASPIMSEEPEELGELIAISSSINLNIGTLNAPFLKKARMAIKEAKITKRKIILDPVGSGATKIRTETALKFLPYANIVRGNASEIMSLVPQNNNSKPLGVDSRNTSNEAIESGKRLAEQHNIVVAISGAIDTIISPSKTQNLYFGDPIMSAVTGMGCALSAVIAAFHAVEEDPFEAAMLATTYFGLCANQTKVKTPGSFRTAFIDSLYLPNQSFMQEKLL